MGLSRFTHIASIYGVQCWFNEHTDELRGTNWLNQQLIELLIGIDFIFFNNQEFKIKLIKEL